jgi:ATP phosphoribosyltransferase regulatory subunit
VTLSIVKNAPEKPGEVRKVYYRENVYRQGRDTGDFREIVQAGLECVGDVGAYEVAEVVYVASKSLAAIGPGTILSLSHVGLIRHALEESRLPEDARQQALDCLRQKRGQELRALCAARGGNAAPLLTLLEARTLADLEPLMAEENEAWKELRETVKLLDPKQVRLDFSLGNDMKYYSGLVFKGYVPGIPASVLSGGQYDRLLTHMGKRARAIGFAVYLDRLPQQHDGWDVDTLLLRGDATPAQILAAAQALEGTVLTADTEPVERCWKRKAIWQNGEVRCLE